MRLDHRAHIFQNLNGAKDEVDIKMQGNVTYAYNSIYDTRAAVYHGNGPSKVSPAALYRSLYCFNLICSKVAWQLPYMVCLPPDLPEQLGQLHSQCMEQCYGLYDM